MMHMKPYCWATQNVFPYDIAPLLARLSAMEAAYAARCEDEYEEEEDGHDGTEDEDEGTEQLISGLALLQSAYTDSSDEE